MFINKNKQQSFFKDYFHKLSIRYKLTLIMLSISVFVLCLSSGAFMVNDLYMLHETMERDLEMQANIVRANITPALAFEDQDDIEEILRSLSENEHIVLAHVYSEKDSNQPLAVYLPENKSAIPLIAPFQNYELHKSPEFLQLSQLMTTPSGEKLGSLVVIMDRNALYDRIQQYIIIASIIVLVSILVAVFLSAVLQHIITQPILILANLTHQVSKQKDYSLRAHSVSKDEMSILMTGFNEMLGAIQERDAKLEEHRNHLERTVAIRTAELRKLNQKLTYQAYHDALTNLPNRALFIKRVEQAISQAEQTSENLAMLFIDLDRFKVINDTLGHSAGDRLLQDVAERLLRCTRLPQDTVARLGGDEFTFLLREINEFEEVGIVADQIIQTLSTPLCYEQQEFYITPSIGISLYPKDGLDVIELMKNADAGMYLAKKQGRNTYRFFTHNEREMSAQRLKMENRLRQALECEQFEVWYQPCFEIATGQIIGAEALVRWRSPELNLVPPTQFIPLAEDTGLIIPIGEWVLHTACEESSLWQQSDTPMLHVSVNISARQFVQENLLEHIEDLIEELSIKPQQLELELTETLIMPNAQDAIETLHSLKKLGIRLSIDDFGTGYSSLSYLKRFPIDTVKIDQCFVRDLSTNQDDKALVNAIIAMAHKLNLTVVAEGVETHEQLQFLLDNKCDFVQGFLCGKPMPAEEFRQVLQHPTPFKQMIEEGKLVYKD